jgi:YVTN family beta-propeller protein
MAMAAGSAAGRQCHACMAYVTSGGGLTPIKVATNTALPTTPVPSHGGYLAGLAVQPNGENAYLGFGDVSGHDVFPASFIMPVHLQSRTVGSPILDDFSLSDVVMAPNGRRFYTSHDQGFATPTGFFSFLNAFTTPTGSRGASVPMPEGMGSFAITPNSAEALVSESGFFASENVVIPVNLHTHAAGLGIGVSSVPGQIAVTRDGRRAYEASAATNTVTPIILTTNTALSPITVGNPGDVLTGIAIKNDQTAFVCDYTSNTVIPINLSTGVPGSAISVGHGPEGIAIDPDGTTAYVANSGDGTVTPITLSSRTAGTPIPVGAAPSFIAVVR